MLSFPGEGEVFFGGHAGIEGYVFRIPLGLRDRPHCFGNAVVDVGL